MSDFDSAELLGRTAFVTGAGSGIGLGIARALARRGATLALCDLNITSLGPVVEELSALGTTCVGIGADVSDRASMFDAAARTHLELGHIDVLVNNAGVSYVREPIWEISEANVRWVLDVNLQGVINGMQAFLPRMIAAQTPGNVLNTSSIGGFVVRPNSAWHVGLYAASKYAVTALSEALSQDLVGTSIGVSILAPFFVSTNIASAGLHRPPRFGGPVAGSEADLDNRLSIGLDPDLAGEMAVQGMLDGYLYIFTGTDSEGFVDARHRAVEAALRAVPEARARAESNLWPPN